MGMASIKRSSVSRSIFTTGSFTQLPGIPERMILVSLPATGPLAQNRLILGYRPIMGRHNPKPIPTRIGRYTDRDKRSITD